MSLKAFTSFLSSVYCHVLTASTYSENHLKQLKKEHGGLSHAFHFTIGYAEKIPLLGGLIGGVEFACHGVSSLFGRLTNSFSIPTTKKVEKASEEVFPQTSQSGSALSNLNTNQTSESVSEVEQLETKVEELKKKVKEAVDRLNQLLIQAGRVKSPDAEDKNSLFRGCLSRDDALTKLQELLPQKDADSLYTACEKYISNQESGLQKVFTDLSINDENPNSIDSLFLYAHIESNIKSLTDSQVTTFLDPNISLNKGLNKYTLPQITRSLLHFIASSKLSALTPPLEGATDQNNGKIPSQAPPLIQENASQKTERLRVEIESLQKKEKVATQKADTLTALFGQNFIRRDYGQQNKVTSTFPKGEDYKIAFEKEFVNLEAFLAEAINKIGDPETSKQPDATNTIEDPKILEQSAKMLVTEVLKPLYESCQNFISTIIESKKEELRSLFPDIAIDESKSNSIDTMFWYTHMQPYILSKVQEVTEDQVNGLMSEEIQKLNKAMASNEVTNHSNTAIFLPQITRSLLKFIALAELSSPRSYLFPPPGTKIRYKEGSTQEVLSPGTKTFGRIQENAEVEVVFPGLYFNNPTIDDPATLDLNVKPAVPLLVKRLNGTPG